MASLCSLPFSIERAAEGSCSVRFRILATIQLGKPSDSVCFRSGSARTWNYDLGSCLLGGERSVRVFRRTGGCSRRIVRLRTASRDPVEGEQEKRLEETIEKSKRVLAVQRELLQQIAERRKLAASIENGTVNAVGGIDSSQENENTSVPDEVCIVPSLLHQNSAAAFSASPFEPERQPFGCSTPEKVEANMDSGEAEAYTIPSFSCNSAAFSASSADQERQTFGGPPPETVKANMDSSEAEAYTVPSFPHQSSTAAFSASSVEPERQPFQSSLPQRVEANVDPSEAEVYNIPGFPCNNATAAFGGSSVEQERQTFGSSPPETVEANMDSSETKAYTIPSLPQQNSTAAFSSGTVEQERQTFGSSLTERVEANMDFSEVEDFSRSSAKIDGYDLYSEEDQAKTSSSDNTLFDLDSAVKTEEIIKLPTLLPMTTETSDPKVKLEEWIVNNFPSNTDEPTPNDTKPAPLAGANVMNVILVAAECSPFSKTGGLGDVAGSLPKALARRGHRVMVIVPKYGDYPEAQNVGVLKRYKAAGQDLEVNYYHAYIDGVDFVFIDSPVFRYINGDIYGGNRLDIWKRNVLFCKAAVEVPWHVPCGGVCYGDGNLVFIANDWHTALLPVYLKAYYRDNGSMIYTRSVLVIHNIAHQGRGPLADFPILDLPEHYVESFRLYDPVGGEHCNIFAAGLKAADRIVTVSHGYAWELKTQEGGWGLHNIIAENDWKLRGIVNGIDPKEWNPKVDSYLQSDGYTNYALETLNTGKPQCKAALQRELGLPERADVPLIGFIGRLDGQKGVDIIADAVPWMMGQDVQLVMLGSGRTDLEQMLKRLESQYYDKARGWVGFSVQMAHRITAGADILLMPSRFEPCGLNQLYAMNYGTIPVVHAVGGLRDTVLPFDPFNETGYGWTFDRAETVKLINALGNCLMTFRQFKQSWEGLQRRGMMQDLSWDHAAEIYEEVLVAAKYHW